MQRNAGMTLLELLVAISILGIITIMGTHGLDSILRARQGLTDDNEEWHGIELAFAQLQNDCARLSSAEQVQGHRLLDVTPEQIVLLRQAPAADAAHPFVVVAYRLHDGALTRQEWPASRTLDSIEQAWQAAHDASAAAPAVVLHRGVREWRARVWQPDGWRDGTAGLRGLPPALQVSLRTRGHREGVLRSFLLGTA